MPNENKPYTHTLQQGVVCFSPGQMPKIAEVILVFLNTNLTNLSNAAERLPEKPFDSCSQTRILTNCTNAMGNAVWIERSPNPSRQPIENDGYSLIMKPKAEPE